jgi:hypothetical protein
MNGLVSSTTAGAASPVVAKTANAWSSRTLFIILALAALQLVLYRQAFGVEPSADDYILAMQIRAGEASGPIAFFQSSPLNDYRPLQSLGYWAMGRWNERDPFPLVHVLNFVAFGFYVGVFVQWLRLLRLPMGGVIAAFATLFFHPILAGPLADLDGFGRFMVSGFVWLGVYYVVRYADRLRWAFPLAALCFGVGLGFMEYALALVPLAPAALWWSRRDRGRTAAAAGLLLLLMLMFGAYYAIRISIIGSDSGRLSMDLVQWITNTALLGGAVLYMGDTVSVYVAQNTAAVATMAASGVAMAALIIRGMRLWHASECERGHSMETHCRTLTLLPLAFVLSFFPMVVMSHISEIYAATIVFAVALMMGSAMAGWSRRPRWYLRPAIPVFVLLLLWASSSVVRKVASLKETGERAQVQIASVLAAIPTDARDVRVALIFRESDLPARRTYSVFRGGDDHLIQPGQSAVSLIEWFRPGRNIELIQVRVADVAQVRRPEYDALLLWDPSTRRFRPL